MEKNFVNVDMEIDTGASEKTWIGSIHCPSESAAGLPNYLRMIANVIEKDMRSKDWELPESDFTRGS